MTIKTISQRRAHDASRKSLDDIMIGAIRHTDGVFGILFDSDGNKGDTPMIFAEGELRAN